MANIASTFRLQLRPQMQSVPCSPWHSWDAHSLLLALWTRTHCKHCLCSHSHLSASRLLFFFSNHLLTSYADGFMSFTLWHSTVCWDIVCYFGKYKNLRWQVAESPLVTAARPCLWWDNLPLHAPLRESELEVLLVAEHASAAVEHVRIVTDFRGPFAHDRQHLSYDGCLEVTGEITRTVLCCIVYWSCAQS